MFYIQFKSLYTYFFNKKFDLIGCRQENTIFEYVPCASCMHSIFDKYKEGNINMDTLKRDLDNLDIMEDMYKARENLQQGFGFKADNSLNQNETKLTGAK